MKCLGIPWHAGNSWNLHRNMPLTTNDWKFQSFHVMPGRGWANIGIWPKSSEYSRCLGITWNAKVTIGTFCRDFVVRECFHSLVAVTLFFSFSEENKTFIETVPFLFVDTSLTNGTGLCTKNPALWNLHKWCKCCAAARNESAKRCDNFTRCPQHHYFLTRHWRTEAACAQYLTALAPLSSALFCIGTRTTRTLSHPLPVKHGLLTERFYKPNVRFTSATHAYALHAHSKPRCHGRRGRGKGRELVRLSTPLQKVPVRNLALHAMPRQRLYPDDFGQITIFAWSLAGISWNA